MADPKLSLDIIDAAILGFEAQRKQIDAKLEELRAMRGGTAPSPAPKGKRTLSEAARQAIAEAQRKRWAAAGSVKAAKPAKKGKRRLSAEGRAAIVAAAKKRWAEARAARK